MHTAQAKFMCRSVERFTPDGTEGTRTFRFTATYDDSIPEDRRFARYTPSGELKITVDNPSIDFQPGKAYYLDFTAVEE